MSNLSTPELVVAAMALGAVVYGTTGWVTCPPQKVGIAPVPFARLAMPVFLIAGASGAVLGWFGATHLGVPAPEVIALLSSGTVVNGLDGVVWKLQHRRDKATS